MLGFIKNHIWTVIGFITVGLVYLFYFLMGWAVVSLLLRILFG